MDPLSIAVSATTLTRLLASTSESLYSFIQGAKKVNETVSGLRNEIDGIKNVVASMAKALMDRILQDSRTSHTAHDLWFSVDNNIVSCHKTAQSLTELLANQRVKGGILDRALNQWRFNQADVANYRMQFQSHAICLQISLQMIHMFISCQLSSRIYDLPLQIAQLQQSIKENLTTRNPKTHSAPAENQGLHNLSQTATVAEKIMFNASVVFELQSGAGSQSDTVAPSDEATSDRVDRWLDDLSTSDDQMTESVKPDAQLSLDESLHLVCKGVGPAAPRILLRLIQDGANVNAKGPTGATPLQIACKKPDDEKVAIIPLLLQAGADVNAAGTGGRTPLQEACSKVDKRSGAVVQQLLRAGADVNAKGDMGHTALYLICFMINHDTAAVVQQLIRAGADVNVKVDSGHAPLNQACLKIQPGAAAVVRELIRGGADVNSHANDGSTPLTCTTSPSNDHPETLDCIRLLISAGAVIDDYSNNWSFTALHHACRFPNDLSPQIIALLIELGADPTLATIDRITPLQLVCKSSHKTMSECVRVLAAAGVDT